MDMSEEDIKKLFDNAPEGSNLALLKEAMEEAVMDTINQQVKELMTNHSLTYGEAMSILAQRWEDSKTNNKK